MFHERTPLSIFKPMVGRRLEDILELSGREISCAREIIDLRIIVITEDDYPDLETRYRGLSLTYESSEGTILNTHAPNTLSGFGKIIDSIKSEINARLTELFCADTEFMKKLLIIHSRVTDKISLKVKEFMAANPKVFKDAYDFNPFAMKGGNVFKLQKYILESNAGIPSSLSNLSDHDFGITFPKSDGYYRECNAKYNMYIPVAADNKIPEDERVRDAKYFELYELIFSLLNDLVRDELAQLAGLGDKHRELAKFLVGLFESAPGFAILDNNTFYPIVITRKGNQELFTMNVKDDSSKRRFKEILSSPQEFIIDRAHPTQYFRNIEMSIVDYTGKNQGVYEDITKNGFRLFRAQLSFNIRISLKSGYSIDKIIFAEIFDYATSFMYTHNMCDSYDYYETLDIFGLKIKSYSIQWFIGDIMNMISGGIESPKHIKRMVRIANLLVLVFTTNSNYKNKNLLRTYLISRSPRDFIIKDKLLELIDKYSRYASPAEDEILKAAVNILESL
jgi:hypothetical protein